MPEPPRQLAFLGISALLFAVSTAATIAWCRSMSDMGEIPMPGGWTLSMAWVPMCGQTWAGAAASFVGMWVVMMVAMMLPSLVPMLWRYRLALGSQGQAHLSEICLGRLTAWVAAGYFFVWTLAGAIVFALGAALAQAVMQMPAVSHAIPVSLGVIVLLAGVLQFTTWKGHHLACCRKAPGPGPGSVAPAGLGTAWQQGVRHGLHCSQSCAGLTAILLVMGVMNPGAMAGITAAITAERLAPAGQRVAHAIGALSVGAGLLLTARAVWPS